MLKGVLGFVTEAIAEGAFTRFLGRIFGHLLPIFKDNKQEIKEIFGRNGREFKDEAHFSNIMRSAPYLGGDMNKGYWPFPNNKGREQEWWETFRNTLSSIEQEDAKNGTSIAKAFRMIVAVLSEEKGESSTWGGNSSISRTNFHTPAWANPTPMSTGKVGGDDEEEVTPAVAMLRDIVVSGEGKEDAYKVLIGLTGAAQDAPFGSFEAFKGWAIKKALPELMKQLDGAVCVIETKAAQMKQAAKKAAAEEDAKPFWKTLIGL